MAQRCASRAPLTDAIPTFMAQWVNMIRGHYFWAGNKAIVEDLYPHLVQLLAFFEKMRNDQGPLEDVPSSVFLDWMPVPDLMPQFGPFSKKRVFTGMNARYYRALIDTSAIATLLGNSPLDALQAGSPYF